MARLAGDSEQSAQANHFSSHPFQSVGEESVVRSVQQLQHLLLALQTRYMPLQQRVATKQASGSDHAPSFSHRKQRSHFSGPQFKLLRAAAPSEAGPRSSGFHKITRTARHTLAELGWRYPTAIAS